MENDRFPLDRSHVRRHEDCKFLLWQTGFMGQGCKVAVVDTGVDLDWLRENGDPAQDTTVHPLDFTPASEGPGDSAPGLHGTRVIREILLSAPRAEIFSLKVYGVTHSPSRQDLAAALEWCVQSGIALVNISTAIYGGECSVGFPCLLCRSINSHALATGMFTVSVGGDAYTLNEMLARGETPVICPANTAVGWAVEGPSVVGDRRQLLERSLSTGGGLSVTTAQFSGGAALLRSAVPSLDIFSLRNAIRRTSIPLSLPRAPNLGAGRHCFFLASLCAQAWAAGSFEFKSLKISENLDAPSGRAQGRADAALCQQLAFIAATFIQRDQWDRAAAAAEETAAAIAPWAGPLDRSLVEHVWASCLESLGQTESAAAHYERSMTLLESFVNAG